MFSDRLKLEKMYKNWIESNGLADSINNFIVFLMKYDLIDEKKALECIGIARCLESMIGSGDSDE